MADVVAKLQVDSSQFDQKLKSAVEHMTKMEKEVRRTGATFAYADKEEIAFIQSLGSMETKTTSAKSQLREYTEALMQMTSTYRNLTQEEKNSDWGKALAASMDEIKGKAAMLRDAMADVNREIGGMASDTQVFNQISGSVGLMVSTFQVGQGALQMFGVKNEDAVKSIVKLQGAMAVTNGLTQIQNALQKESAVMIGVTTVQRKAAAVAAQLEAAAQTKGLVATKAATVAQAAFNVVAKANPYVLLATAVIGVATALYMFTKRSNEAEEAEKKRQKAAEESRKREEDRAKKIANSAATMLSAYQRLKEEWKNLSTIQERNDWIKDNQTAFDNLGISVKNITDAEDAFVKNTAKMVKSFQLRAEAAAYGEMANEAYADYVKMKENLRTKTVSAGQEARGVTSYRADEGLYTLGNNGRYYYTEKGAQQYNRNLINNSGALDLKHIAEGYIKQQVDLVAKANDITGYTSTFGKKENTKSAGGSKSPQEQAEEKVAKALEDYATTINLAGIRKEAGLDDEDQYKQKELSAHERLFDAYTEAYNLYADPKYKEAYDKEAEEVMKLAKAVKELRDAKEEQKKADQELKRAEEEKARQIKQLDNRILGGLTATAKKAGWNAEQLGVTGFKTKINAGIDITEDEWKTIQDNLNQRLQSRGLDPIRIDFETGNIETVIDEAKRKYEELMSSFSTGVGAVGDLVSAMGNMKSIGEDLADVFSGEKDAFDSLMTVLQSGVSIMQTVLSVTEAMNTLKELGIGLSKTKTAAETTEAATSQASAGTIVAAEGEKTAASLASAGADAAEGSAAAGKAVAGIPIVGPILAVAAIATVLGVVLSAISKSKSAGKGFALGGIVPGNSYSGDNLRTSDFGINSGELILNRAQQNNLAGQLRGNPMNDLNLSMEVEGTKMLLLLNNTNRSLGGDRNFYTRRH
jgi:hypothetical protein